MDGRRDRLEPGRPLEPGSLLTDGRCGGLLGLRLARVLSFVPGRRIQMRSDRVRAGPFTGEDCVVAEQQTGREGRQHCQQEGRQPCQAQVREHSCNRLH
jgi:hypothetical protein